MTREERELRDTYRQLRCVALEAASRTGAKDTGKVLRDADSYFRWLCGKDTEAILDGRPPQEGV